MFDTTDVYGFGRSEEALGLALRGRRANVLISSNQEATGSQVLGVRRSAHLRYDVGTLQDSSEIGRSRSGLNVSLIGEPGFSPCILFDENPCFAGQALHILRSECNPTLTVAALLQKAKSDPL
jgi:hypothetical protein